MTQRETTQLQKLAEHVEELESTIERLTKQLADAVGELREAREELRRTSAELVEARQELQQAREEYLTMDRGISELLVAVCGNMKFGQAGIVQRLEELNKSVTDLKGSHDTMKADAEAVKAEVKSLDGTRRWLRAKAAAAAATAGSGIAAGIWYVITHLQQINDWFNPTKH